ncbi:MAG: hemolysin III family protein [Bacteroidales bacterium]|nr:hemolysin III family protein [Bacteroidales bacterium]
MMQKVYSKTEELLNTWSHAFGILGGMIMGIILMVWSVMHMDGYMIWGISLYMFGMIGSYIASTIYHALPVESKWKLRLRKWDHAAIYWHIAGSYSPLTLAVMWQQSVWGLILFIFVWSCAILGTIISFAKVKNKHNYFETIAFVGMGLSIIVAFKPLLDCAGLIAVSWIVAEGVCYITGAIFYSLRKRFMHAVFHFFVLAGSACHIIAIWQAMLVYWE